MTSEQPSENKTADQVVSKELIQAREIIIKFQIRAISASYKGINEIEVMSGFPLDYMNGIYYFQETSVIYIVMKKLGEIGLKLRIETTKEQPKLYASWENLQNDFSENG